LFLLAFSQQLSGGISASPAEHSTLDPAYATLPMGRVTVYLSEGSFVRKVLDRVRVMDWLGLGLGFELELGLWLGLGLGLGLASNLRICTTTFQTNDPSDK